MKLYTKVKTIFQMSFESENEAFHFYDGKMEIPLRINNIQGHQGVWIYTIYLNYIVLDNKYESTKYTSFCSSPGHLPLYPWVFAFYKIQLKCTTSTPLYNGKT